MVNPEERANQGMHYTSVPNIMKVINPLFLDELRGEYNKLNEFYEQRKQMLQLGAINQKQFYEDLKPVIKKGNALLKRMSQMKFFDPACGSGNFLIITYKCLRFLEMDILALQQKCTPQGEILFVDNSVISLSQFYGIELLDFPHEVAMLSLWLAEHQMNTKLNEDFGVNTKALPLKNITQIVCGNACRIDWNTVCPHTPDEEVYIFGNPPYLGSSMQDKSQKDDKEIVLGKLNSYKDLDYIACWFYLGAKYIQRTKAKYAFVSTNSICQGEQVAMIWEPIFDMKLEIGFAHTSFKWNNNAKHNAAVICVIVGVQAICQTPKSLYLDGLRKDVDSISCYLIPNISCIVRKCSNSLSGLPKMLSGNKASDGGFLILDKLEKDSFVDSYPQAAKYIKRLIGALEFIRGDIRYCLFIRDNELEEAIKIPEIKHRLEKVTESRLQSTEKSTVNMAQYPNRFYYDSYQVGTSIIIPSVSSERRSYIPIGLLENDVIVAPNLAVYNAEVWIMGVLTSLLHMLWVKTVGGRLKTDYRYSAQLCYNTFPFPKISAEKKKEIESAAEEVLITREYYPEKTLAELYDPDKMPQDLREAHAKLDDIVESPKFGSYI